MLRIPSEIKIPYTEIASLFFSINPNRKNVNRKGGLIKVPSPGTITGNYKQVKACHQNLFCIITRLNDIITINVNVNSLTLISSLDFHAVIWLVHPIFTTTLVTPCLMIYFDLNRFIQTKTVSLSSKFWISLLLNYLNRLQVTVNIFDIKLNDCMYGYMLLWFQTILRQFLIQISNLNVHRLHKIQTGHVN